MMRNTLVEDLVSFALGGLLGFLLTACSMGVDFAPAIAANQEQATTYSELQRAFKMTIEGAHGLDPAVKARALADIEANRADFTSFNKALDEFLQTAGDFSSERMIEIAEAVRKWRENR